MPFEEGKIANPKGRGKGTLNKKTEEIKKAFDKLLHCASPHMIRWIAKVANGTPDKLDNDGSVFKKGVAPNPEKAFYMVMAMTEFVMPKLSRQEVENRHSFKELIKLQNDLKTIATIKTLPEPDQGEDDSSVQEIIQG